MLVLALELVGAVLAEGDLAETHQFGRDVGLAASSTRERTRSRFDFNGPKPRGYTRYRAGSPRDEARRVQREAQTDFRVGAHATTLARSDPGAPGGLFAAEDEREAAAVLARDADVGQESREGLASGRAERMEAVSRLREPHPQGRRRPGRLRNEVRSLDLDCPRGTEHV